MAKVAAKAKDRPVKKKQTVGMKILTIQSKYTTRKTEAYSLM